MSAFIPAIGASLLAASLAFSSGSPVVAEANVDLQALIDATPSWETLTLAPGTYRGRVVIDKPITIDGGGVAMVDGLGEGNTIEVTSGGVVLKRLEIRSTGDSLDRENAAVSATAAPGLTVEDCVFEDVLFGVFSRESPGTVVRRNVIGAKDLEVGRRGDALRLWESPGSLVEGNTVAGGRDSVIWFSDGTVVRDNRFTGGRYGLHFMYDHGVIVERNQLEGNSVGAYLMYSSDIEFRDNVVAGNHGPSGYGLGLKDVDGVTADGNRFVGNRVGIYLDNSPVGYDVHQYFSGNLVAFNQVGVLFTPSVQRNHFSGNAFVDNREQVGVSGTGTFTGNEWTIDGVGNHWDDFGGYDADGDGIGDIPYRLADLYSTLTDRHPEIVFFAETPAASAIALTARLFPALRPEPKVIDEAPLIAMPEMAPPIAGLEAPHARGLISASLAMLAMAALLVTASRPARRLRP